MKIVFYNKTLISGGIEKCLEILGKYIHKDYELEIVYTDDSILDTNIVEILSKYAKVYKIQEGMKIECDLCVWCYLYFDYKLLKSIINAKQYITWIHSMPRILPDCLLDDNDFVKDSSRFICVSEAVKNNLNISKEGEVIHNFIDPKIKELSLMNNPFVEFDNSILKFAVVSRLSAGKGFDRLYLLCESLEKNNIPYKVMIIGKGRKREIEIREKFSIFKNVIFIGYQENPHPYVKNADYLVQLSDDESWCNSITEAKILGTPVIVTNFESSKEQIKHLKNGIVIDLNATDYDQYIPIIIGKKEVLKNNLSSFEYKNEIEKWIQIFDEVK